MARATDGNDDEEGKEGSTAGDEKPQEEEPTVDTPSKDVRRAMDAVLGEVLTASPSAAEDDHHSVSSDEPAEIGSPGGSSGNVSGDEQSTQPTPEVRRAMNSVLSQMTGSPAAAESKPQSRGPRVGGQSKRTQVAAPPEPSMKDTLDQIIKQAVEKAAKRVAEAPSESGESDVAPSAPPPPPPPPPPPAPESGPESPPVVDNIGDGMHRIRSKKNKQAPAFDMNELMARFGKNNS